MGVIFMKFVLDKGSLHNSRNDERRQQITINRNDKRAIIITFNNIYAHALQSVDELAAGKLGDLLRPMNL